MLTEGLLAFGGLLTRVVFRKDLKAAVQEGKQAGEFDTAYRLLENTVRAIYCVMAWMALVVISLVPWWGLTTLFRASSPTLTRAIADVGSGVVAFAMTGFSLNLLRMAIAVSLARREASQDLARAGGARSGAQPASSTELPGGLVQLALVVTRPTDFDFVLQAIAGILVVVALANHSQTQGYPL
jgi:hypothetical protein